MLISQHAQVCKDAVSVGKFVGSGDKPHRFRGSHDMGYVVLLALLPRGFGSDVRVRTGRHYICHGLIEAVRKCCVGGVGVFDSIMEQRGDHLVLRPPTLAHDGRHTQEVGDIGDTSSA